MAKVVKDALGELLKGAKPGQWVTLPSTMTAELLRAATSQQPEQTALNLFLNPANSPRDVVFDSFGIVEQLIDELLLLRFVEDAKDSLMGPRGSLIKQSVELKFSLAYGLNLFNCETHVTINLVRKIRNCFAHNTHIRSFDHDQVVLGLTQSLPDRPAIPFSQSTSKLNDRYRRATFALICELAKIRRSLQLKPSVTSIRGGLVSYPEFGAAGFSRWPSGGPSIQAVRYGYFSGIQEDR